MAFFKVFAPPQILPGGGRAMPLQTLARTGQGGYHAGNFPSAGHAKMAKLVTIYGGSGFLGRQIARIMARDGWRVRVACRRTNEAGFVRTYGAVGQVMTFPCNVRDDALVAAAMEDADAVINCVGVMGKSRGNTLESINVEAAGRIARIAAEKRIARLVHISALGADPEAQSAFARSKGKGEAAVLAARPDAVILRPSVMFGMDDQFYNRLGGMRLGIALPGIDEAMLQPVFVDDVAAAAAMGADGRAQGRYDLGGPDVMTARQIGEQVRDVTERKTRVMGMPVFLGACAGGVFRAADWLDGTLTVEQGARGFDALGIAPTPAEAVLPDYMWRFRKDGQYAAMKASAKNLRQFQ